MDPGWTSEERLGSISPNKYSLRESFGKTDQTSSTQELKIENLQFLSQLTVTMGMQTVHFPWTFSTLAVLVTVFEWFDMLWLSSISGCQETK